MPRWTGFGFAVLGGLGIGLVAVSASFTLGGMIARHAALTRQRLAARLAIQQLPAAIRELAAGTEAKRAQWLDRWSQYAQPQIELLRLPITPVAFGLALLAAALGGAAFGLLGLHNPLAGIAIAVAMFMLPEQILAGFRDARQNRLMESLSATAQVLGAQMQDTRNLHIALRETAARAPQPMAGLLGSSVQELDAGMDPDAVCARLGSRLRFEHGRLFAQLLRAAWDDVSVARLFPRLATRVSNRVLLGRKVRSALAVNRLVGIVLNALSPLAFFGARFLVPDATRYMTEEPFGRLVVTAAAVAALLGIWLDRLLRRVEV